MPRLRNHRVNQQLLPAALSPRQFAALDTEPPQIGAVLGNFVVAKQEERNWCWATVAQNVTARLDGRKIDQCEIIHLTRGISSCCDNHATCKEPFFTDQALAALMNLREPKLMKPLTPEEIKIEIPAEDPTKGRPIGCGFDDQEKGGHAIVIFGWDIQKDRFRLHVGDPDGGVTNVEFLEDLIDGEGREWSETYKTKKRSNQL